MFVAEVTLSSDPVGSAKTDGQPISATPNPAHLEESYRARLKRLYGTDAAYFVPLTGSAHEILPADPAKSRRSAGRRRARPEYQEWVPSGDEIRHIKLESLNEAVVRYPCVILLGDPGCGKTSTLENLAFEFADDVHLLPVPLYLGDLNPSDRLEEFVTRSWMSLLDNAPLEAEEASAILYRYLESGRLLFLIDALNEMPLGGYRENCLALRQFIDRWSLSGNRFVVSCRILDYGEELSGLQRVEVQPLSDESVHQFIKNELPDNWEALWREFTESGDKSRRLLEIARNPYMLTVMIDVFAADGKLVQNRAELMRRFVGILMGWATAKGVSKPVSSEAAMAAISVAAFEMQRRSGFGTTSKTDDVIAFMRGDGEAGSWPVQSYDQFLRFAASAKIIEMPVDRKTVRFYHQLLQEFFAAQRVLRLDPSELSELWRSAWLESEMPAWPRPHNNFEPLAPPPSTGWEETTILAAGLAHAEAQKLIGALCRSNPILAARCVLEHPAIGQATRAEIADRLYATVADPDVALRVRIAAGEMLGCLGDRRAGEMALIPAGKFLMGEGAEQHEVFLRDYQIGRYPVTNAEYARFVSAGGYADRELWTAAGWREVGNERNAPRLWQNPRFNKPAQPVIGLSWYECVAYCRWLRRQTGRIHRLPTEAEWEKAARGADGRAYPWGDAFDARRLNAREGNQKVYCSTPIGIYPTGVSPFGLLDCAGNCWEWCATRWKKSFPYDADEDEWSEAYLEAQNLRALRGGSWNYEAEVTRCANRFRFEPFGWNDRGGMRLVCPTAH
jgi:formylglycine-generating enzyme required for sulfatase activity